MPNYRYNSPEYARRGNCARTMPAVVQTPACAEPEKPSCCEERAVCDELNGMPIAMAYVPWQEWRNIYEAEKGLRCGTIFEELNKPFKGMGGSGR